jgi:uncharacterized protein
MTKRSRRLITLSVVIITVVVGCLILRATATRWLIGAVSAGDEIGAKRSLILGANPCATDHEGISLLSRAAAEGRSNIVKMLISRGAKLDRGTGQGEMTPLMFAAFWGHRQVVSNLLAGGANINATDLSGETALFCAARGRDPSIFRLLLDQGADASLRNDSGRTVLWLAAFRGNTLAVSNLLERGGEGTNNAEKERACIAAIEQGHTNTARLIREWPGK